VIFKKTKCNRCPRVSLPTYQDELKQIILYTLNDNDYYLDYRLQSSLR